MTVVLISEKSDLEAAIEQAVSKAIREQVPEIIREATAKPWLTKEELRELTGWSSRTLQNLRDTNQIPYSQHGHKILYPRDGIMKFLEDHKIPFKK
jgi:hypothetical protein